jgi:hypothetical protein
MHFGQHATMNVSFKANNPFVDVVSSYDSEPFHK